MQHADKDIAQRCVVMRVKSQMLSVAKPTPREDDGEVEVVVDVGISHVAAIEHHRVVQQAAVSFLNLLEIPKQFPKQFHLCDFDLFQLF